MAISIVSRTQFRIGRWLNAPPQFRAPISINIGSVSVNQSIVVYLSVADVLREHGNGGVTDNFGQQYIPATPVAYAGNFFEPQQVVYLPRVTNAGNTTIRIDGWVGDPAAFLVVVLNVPISLFSGKERGFPAPFPPTTTFSPVQVGPVSTQDGDHYVIAGCRYYNPNLDAVIAPPSGFTDIVRYQAEYQDGIGGRTGRHTVISDRLVSSPSSDLTVTWPVSPVRSDVFWSALAIVFFAGLIAEFSGTPTSGVSPLTVSFTDESIGSPTAWDWHFGDGARSSQQNPTHQYASPGVYTVTMFISRGPFAQTGKSRSGYIVVDGATDPPPEPPGLPGRPKVEGTGIPPGLLWALGPGYWSMLGQPNPAIQAIPYGDPEPDQTAAEVEQEILLQGLLDALMQVLAAAQGTMDPAVMEAAIRQTGQYLDGLMIAGTLIQTGEADYELVTQGFADQDVPTSSDAGQDGDVWLAEPGVHRSRRERMPPDQEREDEAPTIWVCVLDGDGVPVWFQVETYPSPEATSLGVTGEF